MYVALFINVMEVRKLYAFLLYLIIILVLSRRLFYGNRHTTFYIIQFLHHTLLIVKSLQGIVWRHHLREFHSKALFECTVYFTKMQHMKILFGQAVCVCVALKGSV